MSERVVMMGRTHPSMTNSRDETKPHPPLSCLIVTHSPSETTEHVSL